MLSSLVTSSSVTPATAGPDPIKDVGLASFVADVLEASKKHLVIVDFWAPWCGPCKQLGPVLEKLVRSYKGAVHLAKIDIDQNQEIAQQMGVQSIPAVFAFFQGRPVDGFAGTLPESQIKAWLEHLIKATGSVAPAGEEAGFDTALKQAAEFLATNDVATAQSIYADILDAEPTNVMANAGLMRCLMAVGDVEAAKRVLASVPAEAAKDKLFDPIRAAIELAEQAAQGGPIDELQAKIVKDPADHQARFDLAMAHYAVGQKEEAVDQLLELIRRQRNWNEDAARKQLVKFFEAFGVMDPLTVSARKRLSSILFS